MAKGDFKFNPDTAHWEATKDGVYERQADNPVDRIRVQMRKGYPVTEADAQLFSWKEGWPGEEEAGTSAAAAEDAATASAKQAAPPDNKAASPPENKSA